MISSLLSEQQYKGRWTWIISIRKILTILQQNARTPLKVIAEQVFLSSPAVSARIERLEAAGYILGYQAQLSCAAMGYQIKAFINLEVEPSQKPEFYPVY